MVYTEDSNGQKLKNGSDEGANTIQGNNECKEMGNGGCSGDDKGSRKRRKSRRVSFEEPDLTIKDGNGNEFRISVNKTPYRYYRLELFVNGHPITPMTFPGTQPIRSYWEMLKSTFKG